MMKNADKKGPPKKKKQPEGYLQEN